jgi:beta-phosphoglucomutase-like phosphatase (HAD superfamily)
MPKIVVPGYIKGLIFDCDGTLVDSMPLHWSAWEKAVVLKGGVWRPEFFSSTKGMPEEDIVVLYNERFSLDLDPVDTVRIKHEYFRSHASRLRPVLPVLDVVHRYGDRVPMAVASGGVRENVMLELEALNIRHFFQAILTADDDVRPKPSPDIFLEAAKRIGVSPGDCQVFEDGDLGLEAARAAGMLPTDIRKYEGQEG